MKRDLAKTYAFRYNHLYISKDSLWAIIRVAVVLCILVYLPAAFAFEPDAGPDAGAVPATGPTTASQTADSASTEKYDPLSDEATVEVKEKRLPPPGTVSQIDAAEISLRGARNVPEALALEPSIEVQQSPKAGSVLQIRGFDERTVLLMFEGIPIAEIYDGQFNIAALPTFALGSIELERGVTSVLYGPNSMAGILALSAPTACDDLVDVSALGGRLHTGRLMLYGGSLKACKKISDFTFHVSAGYEHSDGYVLSNTYKPNTGNAQFHEDGGVRDGSDYERANAAVLVTYAPRKNKNISLFVDYIHAPRGIPTHEGSGEVRYWRFVSYNTLLVGISGTYGPELDKIPLTWGFRELTGQIYTQIFYDKLRSYADETYERLTTTSKWFQASEYANDTFGAAIQSTWNLNSGNRLDLSLRYNFDFHMEHDLPVPVNGEVTNWNPWKHYSAHTYTIAVEDTQVLGSWKVNAGFAASGMSLISRDEQNSDDEDNTVDHRVIPAYEGRLVIEKTLGESFRLMMAAGHKVRFPKLKELFSYLAGGDVDLNPERAWMTEAGFDSTGVPIDGLDTIVRVFYNSIEDLIIRYQDQDKNYHYGNVGRAVTAGVELEVKYKPVDFLQIFSGYRYLYAYDLENDHPLDYRTLHRVAVGARLLTKIGFTYALEATYNSGQESYTLPKNEKKWVVKESLPSYALVNAHIRYEQAGNDRIKLYLYLDAFNLFDINYYAGSFDPRPGREVILGIGGRI